VSMLSAELVQFLAELRQNNEKAWFDANRKRYETVMKKPANAFADALCGELDAATGLSHGIKVFRIHRDIRFSKDKTPYNSHLHIAFFPETDEACRSAWMFGLEPEALALGLGSMEFPKELLERWRERVSGPDGEALAGLLAAHEARGARLSDPALKRVPAPYPQDHPRADLLRRKGLSVWIDHTDLTLAYGADGPKRMAAELLALRDVSDWLRAL